MTYKEWVEKGKALFGDNKKDWKFVCPVCGHVASAQDYLDKGAPEGAIGYSCIGRWTEKPKDMLEIKPGEEGPCNYAGGGLFCFNPLTIITPDGTAHTAFCFYEED